LKEIQLSIFGDNILECERMLTLIRKAIPELHALHIETKDASGVYTPLITLSNSNLLVSIQFYPDYKSSDRWGDKSILKVLEDNGAKLMEAPDIILTESREGKEYILLAIEFSSAIPAGNQAWQRSGRALSFSEVFIPYLYITDIGLEELDNNRGVKATRSSSPLVPLSYIKHSQRNKTFVLMVLNPSYLLESSEQTSKFIVKDEVTNIVRGIIFKKDIKPYLESLELKIGQYLDSYKNIPPNISFMKWIKLNDSSIESYIKSFKFKYKKKISIKTPLKASMRLLIANIIPNLAISIYNNLPVCLIPSDKRETLAKEIKKLCYPNLDKKIYNWISSNKAHNQPLIVCLVNGFKPRGDDARPDRGLVPLARMLFGKNIDILTLVFGQAPLSMQNLFASSPIKLADKNGLWKSILYYSSLTIADSINWTLPDDSVAHFQLKSNSKPLNPIFFTTPGRTPIKFNENDIDTVIHMKFSYHKSIFESLCNPPGGDWSGISFLDKAKNEHRWMSLPRISDKSKRPDHIFQICHCNQNFIFIIESKEKLSDLLKDKKSLGNDLISYVKKLIKHKSSAIKINDVWQKNTEKPFTLTIDKYVSGVAFFCKDENDIKKAIAELNVDIIITLSLGSHMLNFKGKTKIGNEMLKILRQMNVI